jgi:hypothetical protein
MPARERTVYGDPHIRIWHDYEEGVPVFGGEPKYKKETIKICFSEAGTTIEVNPEILESLHKTAEAFLEDWKKTGGFSEE